MAALPDDCIDTIDCRIGLYRKNDVVISHARRLEGSADDGKRWFSVGRYSFRDSLFIYKVGREFEGGYT